MAKISLLAWARIGPFRYLLRAVEFLLVCLAIISPAMAVLPPADKYLSREITFDSQIPPANNRWGTVPLVWNELSGYDENNALRWGRNGWVCLSESDTSLGACPTTVADSFRDQTATVIRLTFTEKRTKMRREIPLKGEVFNHWIPPSACGISAGGFAGAYGAAASSSYSRCPVDGKETSRKGLNISVSREHLMDFPGGIWTAMLVMKEMQWAPYQQVAVWTMALTLDVTNASSADIYLPAFGTATPRADLNLRTRPLTTAPGGEVFGKTVIDVCLYDGYNANSWWLTLKLSDGLTIPARTADLFSVVKTGVASTDIRQRIDYRVIIKYNDTDLEAINGQERVLFGTNRAKVRMVAIPGVPQPVACVPTPLTLDVVPFAKASKAAGRYEGILRVNLTATAIAP